MNMRHNQLAGTSAPDAVMFEVELSLDTDRGTARLIGELDIASADRLHAVLDQLRNDGYRHVVLDLSELEFLSATGLGVLDRAAADYADYGGSLTLAHPNRMARRVLALTGLEYLTASTQDTLPGSGGRRHRHARGLSGAPPTDRRLDQNGHRRP